MRQMAYIPSHLFEQFADTVKTPNISPEFTLSDMDN